MYIFIQTRKDYLQKKQKNWGKLLKTSQNSLKKINCEMYGIFPIKFVISHNTRNFTKLYKKKFRLKQNGYEFCNRINAIMSPFT